MNSIILAIIVFSIVSIAASVNSTNPRNRRPQRPPWFPVDPPGPVSTPRAGRPEKKVWPELTELDPDKEQETGRAMGREGAWGDEGRPSRSRSGGKAPVSPQQPVARMGETTVLVNSPVPVEDPVPDLVNTANPLVHGIIWAEILGRPRAVRPHRGPRG